MKATSKKAKKLVDKENLGEALHVALRKGCDSLPTSLMWNLINLDNSEAWPFYLEHVWTHLNRAIGSSTALPMALKEASLTFRQAVNQSKQRDKLNGYLVTCFDIAFDQFTASDWEGFACYLEEA